MVVSYTSSALPSFYGDHDATPLCRRQMTTEATKVMPCVFYGDKLIIGTRAARLAPGTHSGLRDICVMDHHGQRWYYSLISKIREITSGSCGASTSYRQKDDALRSWNERAHEKATKDA